MVRGNAVQASLRCIDQVRRSADWSGWRELSREAPPFLLPEFFALTATLAQGEALVATASRSGRVVGALPLVRWRHQLHRLGCRHTPNFDYWGAPEGLDAIWSTLRRDRGWSELFLEDVPAGSSLVTRLPELAGADLCPTVVRPGPRQRYLVLPGFEDRLDSRFRMGLRRCERKAGGLELERVVRPTRVDFEEAIAIEAMAWKGAAGTNIGADPRIAHLYAALGRLLGWGGRAQIYFLRMGGRRMAVVLTAEDAHTLYAFKVGYDPKHAALGPGHLLFWKVAADAERRGLKELNFLGSDSEWKRKWTDRTRELVSVRVYQRSVRGLASYGVREVAKPRLPEAMRDLRTPLRRGCQRGDIIGAHPLKGIVRGRLQAGLEIGRRLLRAGKGHSTPREPLGEPSRFAPRDWVRVLDATRIQATLDSSNRTRGLKFIAQQWVSCGQVYRVERQVRRIRDDRGQYRPVARTVLLETLSCAGVGPGPGGCGRHCPTMFRDEWLEPASRPSLQPPGPSKSRHARVRGREEVAKGLDLAGRRDGLTFMPEMTEYAGRRLRIVERLSRVFEYDRWVDVRTPIYFLEGARCRGSVIGEAGRCERACSMLWHEDWLFIEPTV